MLQISTLALVPVKHFWWLWFKFMRNFWLWAPRSSTASVLSFELWRVHRASLRAWVDAISIAWSGRRWQRWLAQASSRLAQASSRRAPEQGADWQPPPAALPGQLCCWYTVVVFIVLLNLKAAGTAAGHWIGQLKQYAGLKLCLGSIRPLLPIFPLLLHHYYLLWWCYDSNNSSVIAYLYIIIMALLHVNMPVFTSLLPVVTVIMGHYYYYLVSSKLLPIIDLTSCRWNVYPALPAASAPFSLVAEPEDCDKSSIFIKQLMLDWILMIHHAQHQPEHYHQ